MKGTMWRLGLVVAITLCFSVNLAACTVGRAETLPAAGQIVTYSASTTVSSAPTYQATLAPACGPGEQLLAGGYNATDVFESALFLDASYPSSLHTWTVSAHSTSSFDLQALLYCLRGGPSLGEQIVVNGACPRGTTLLSQGERGQGTMPLSQGIRSATTTTLCAAHDVTLGARLGDFQVGGYAAHCANTALGSNLSETRAFSYTCQFHQTQG